MIKRIFQLVLVDCLAIATLFAADDVFVGKWKLNPSKSTLTDEMKVASAGRNRFAFDFGSGNPETVVADGSDQPADFGTTLSVSVAGPNQWKVVRKKEGHTIITATWELSEDGNTLTDHFTSIQPNGTKSSVDYVYKRTAGTSGFAGTWEASQQVTSVFELQIQPYQLDGLSFVSPVEQVARNLKFDGQDYPASGMNLPKGFTSSGHRVDARTLQLTNKVDGKVVDQQQFELSPDLKTLTRTVRTSSQGKPTILVFERE